MRLPPLSYGFNTECKFTHRLLRCAATPPVRGCCTEHVATPPSYGRVDGGACSNAPRMEGLLCVSTPRVATHSGADLTILFLANLLHVPRRRGYHSCYCRPRLGKRHIPSSWNVCFNTFQPAHRLASQILRHQQGIIRVTHTSACTHVPECVTACGSFVPKNVC
jgi:hypothetical protein